MDMETASPPVSPSVVAAIMMIQNARVRAGSLLRPDSLWSCMPAQLLIDGHHARGPAPFLIRGGCPVDCRRQLVTQTTRQGSEGGTLKAAAFYGSAATALEELRQQGLYKVERQLRSPQGAIVLVGEGAERINLCSNNYLGLANHPAVIQAAHQALDRYGYGMASVRFICRTHEVHRELHGRLSAFLRTPDTLLSSSCFDANGGLFATLLGDADAVISDALNHASIIDGIRLC